MKKGIFLYLAVLVFVAVAVFSAGCASNSNQAPPNASATNDNGQQVIEATPSETTSSDQGVVGVTDVSNATVIDNESNQSVTDEVEPPGLGEENETAAGSGVENMNGTDRLRVIPANNTELKVNYDK